MGGFKYSCEVDTRDIKKHTRNICLWKESIGKSVYFNFDNGKFTGELKIIGHELTLDKKHTYLYLEYNGQQLKRIEVSRLLKGKLLPMMSDYYIPYKYNIGDTAPNNSDIIIVDRTFKKRDTSNRYDKCYKIKCLKCGYDSSEYYVDGNYKKEYWVEEYAFSNMTTCPCCCSKLIAPGINDILTVYPDLSRYFCEPEKLIGISVNSKNKFRVKCLDCGNEYTLDAATIVRNNGVPCICKDTISYPNKLSYYLFKSLVDDGQAEYHCSEYSPSWAGQYRYDNYVVKDGVRYLIEMDSTLGHGNLTFWGDKDIEGKERDVIKDRLAMKNNIDVIRIDCTKPNLYFIKDSILSSKLANIFDFSNVNWELLDKESTKNIHRMICLDYETSNLEINDLAEKYHFCNRTIRSILKKGTQFGWCSYKGIDLEKTEQGWVNKTAKDNAKKNKALILEYCKTHDEYSGAQIERDLGIGISLAIKALKELNAEGLIQYDIKFVSRNRVKNARKAVCVYDMDDNFIREYESISSCARNSVKDFGVQFSIPAICETCANKHSHHKNYKFKYKD